GCDAGVRMHGHACSQSTQVGLEQIEKYERLQLFAEVGWAHQAADRTVPLSASPMNDSACHDWFLSKARGWMVRRSAHSRQSARDLIASYPGDGQGSDQQERGYDWRSADDKEMRQD